MTQLFAHPDVEDYFVEHHVDAGSLTSGVGSKVADDFANERLILIRGFRFDADLKFLQSLSFLQKWRWKKLAVTRFQSVPEYRRRFDAEIVEFVADVFGNDWGRFDYFLAQASAVNEQTARLVEALFSAYRFQQRHIIWRFTETRVENLHFDVDRNCDDLELVRLYVNLDDVPRIWYTAGTFSTVSETYYESLGLSRFKGQSNDALLKRLDTGAFGDWNHRGRDTVPRHLVLFEPGDIWIVDGRRVSHQVMYGRRVVSTLFVAGPDGIPDPAKTFAQSVAVLHERMAQGIQRPRAVAHSLVRQSKNKLDLRASWEELPDHIRQESLIRL